MIFSLVVLFTFSFIFALLADGLQILQLYDRKGIEIDRGNFYISIQHESNPLDLPNSIQTINGFKEIIDFLNNSSFDYYEMYTQHLDFSFEQNADLYFSVTDQLVSSGDHVKSVQISENVQKDFDFSLSSGRFLLPKDFNHKKGVAIPVLMGSAYSDIYEIGDVFSAYYLFSPFSFEIVGFLKSSSEISLSSGSIHLSKYIVMPSINFDDLPQSDTDYVTQKIHYANKTSGKAKTTESGFDYAYSYIKSILENSTVGSYSTSSSSAEKYFLVHGLNLEVLIYTCYLLSFVFAISALLFANKNLNINSSNSSKLIVFLRIGLLSTFFIIVSLLISLVCSSILLLFIGLKQTFPPALFIIAILLWIVLASMLSFRLFHQHDTATR